MSNPITMKPEEREYSLNVPLGQVYVTKEARAALDATGVAIDDVLLEHGSGRGGDADYDLSWDNYHAAADGDLNASVHDLDEDEGSQVRVVTTPDREVTIVWLHTEAE